jgi:N-methylhydantoinase A
VTDADLLLGHFPGDSLMAGAMGLDRGAAVRAVDEQVAGPLGMSTTEAAAGILRIVDARMADAIRVGISGRGLDPRDFALVVGGGAGPLHVSRIARELGIGRTIIPEHPGTMSAYGVAVTDRRHEASISLGILLAEETREDLAGSLRNLKDDVTRVFASEDVPDEQLEFNESLDLRYVSERGDIQVRIQGHMDTAELAALQKEFSRLHEGVYGFTGEGQNIVIVRAKVTGTVPSRPPSRSSEPSGPAGLPAEAETTQKVFFPEANQWLDTKVIRRDHLMVGVVVRGPCLIPEPDSTTLVLPGQHVSVLADRSLLVAEDA